MLCHTRLLDGEDVNDTLSGVCCFFEYVITDFLFSCAIVLFVLAFYNERCHTLSLVQWYYFGRCPQYASLYRIPWLPKRSKNHTVNKSQASSGPRY
ncbi:hypothetical protein BDV06DRAFT_55348 [Aspergillus oleicola]